MDDNLEQYLIDTLPNSKGVSIEEKMFLQQYFDEFDSLQICCKDTLVEKFGWSVQGSLF